ncbi:DUF6119 family protein [Chromobacterium piscinae]|uniref:DUF6119 family protein n=1 Tax=Chromobacterium piscinae TaxID=686831 RepID=UPI001E4159C1|nr:DUF6119 family protein [Chromobacterium piscinae]MCD5328385.1 TIGR04141 family sporadically distributed protein [Chromobacterium piscinae]
MSTAYNIYKLRSEYLEQLLEKISSVGLAEQKTINDNGYKMTFYFSENVKGNPIWWWNTYNVFFKDGIVEPHNIFHFALLISIKEDSPDIIYLVSLGKAHFYLNKYIEHDFGINFAIRIGDEKTTILKKSRYFAGSKRNEVSAYVNFSPNSYEPGESVDHVKIKAVDASEWGEKNIILADSIQIDTERSPSDLADLFNKIRESFSKDELIKLPKLEIVRDENIINELDIELLESIKKGDGDIVIDEFPIYGTQICVRTSDCEYMIFTKSGRGKREDKKDLGSAIQIENIASYLVENNISDINEVKVKISSETVFSQDVKELIDCRLRNQYLLKNGEWYLFNQTFMDYLKKALENIAIQKMDDLNEADYVSWKASREQEIRATQENLDADALATQEFELDKITYREFYFNKKQRDENGFILLDRSTVAIKSIKKGARNYQVEIADLYKNEEIISVKISDKKVDLIYNIHQSATAIEVISRNVVPEQYPIKSVAIWLVLEKEITKITDLNSIQLLLALETWRKKVSKFNLTPKIYISKHVK